MAPSHVRWVLASFQLSHLYSLHVLQVQGLFVCPSICEYTRLRLSLPCYTKTDLQTFSYSKHHKQKRPSWSYPYWRNEGWPSLGEMKLSYERSCGGRRWSYMSYSDMTLIDSLFPVYEFNWFHFYTTIELNLKSNRNMGHSHFSSCSLPFLSCATKPWSHSVGRSDG